MLVLLACCHIFKKQAFNNLSTSRCDVVYDAQSIIENVVLYMGKVYTRELRTIEWIYPKGKHVVRQMLFS